jgi:hypothetical protein
MRIGSRAARHVGKLVLTGPHLDPEVTVSDHRRTALGTPSRDIW